MSWTDADGWSFGDPCIECGEETSAEHRKYCDSCYAKEQGWTRPRRAERPPPGEAERVTLAGLVELRRQLQELRKRIDALEQKQGNEGDEAA